MQQQREKKGTASSDFAVSPVERVRARIPPSPIRPNARVGPMAGAHTPSLLSSRRACSGSGRGAPQVAPPIGAARASNLASLSAARAAAAAAHAPAQPRRRPPSPANPFLAATNPAIIPPLGLGIQDLPSHLAIILDGNRRWARGRGLPDRDGYTAGVSALTTAVAACLAWGIPALTVYGFSAENWARGVGSTVGVLGVAAAAARAHAPDLADAGVRLRFIPRGLTRPRPLVDALRAAEAVTDAGSDSRAAPALHLTVALSYSARADLGNAAAAIAADAAAGCLDPASVTADTLAARLSTAAVLPPHLANPDLIIRTGGERRLSNFLLFEAAYAELAFIDTLWPDVGVRELEDVMRDFVGRERRYGRE